MKALQAHLNKWLLVYVVLAMGLGVLVGHPQANWLKAHQGGLSTLTTVAVFVITYPMMVNLRFGGLLRQARTCAVERWRSYSTSSGHRFWVMGSCIYSLCTTLRRRWDSRFLLVMVVPCSSMALGYTGCPRTTWSWRRWFYPSASSWRRRCRRG